MRFAAIDFETANRGADSACAVGVVMAEDGRIVHRETHLICPPPGEFVFTYIHGLDWDDVCDAPDFGRVWSGLGPLLEDVDFLAAHNAPFDRRVLHADEAVNHEGHYGSSPDRILDATLPSFRSNVVNGTRSSSASCR